MNNHMDKILGKIPRTEEEMADLKTRMFENDSQEVLDKSYKINDRIATAKKMLEMFESDIFKKFWKAIHDDMLVDVDGGVRSITGNNLNGMTYDPLGQIAQLNRMQGGIELLDAQTMQMEMFTAAATQDPIDVEEMKANLQNMKQFEDAA